MGDNSLYHVLALISKNHKYNKMKSSFIYLLFLEESHNDDSAESVPCVAL